MSIEKPVLHVFGISHFSEKARWALDHHGIAYVLNEHVPGFHLVMIKRLGLKRSWVPVLEMADGVVQGSGAIIDWADAHGSGAPLTPPEGPLRDEAMALEALVDREIGEALRRITYATLLNDPATTCELWSRGAPAYKRWVLRAAYPKLRSNVGRIYKLSPERVAQSKVDLDARVSSLEAQLAENGGSYLIGDSLSRVDIAVAALLAPWTCPPEHPFAYPAADDAELAAYVASYEQRPLFTWARALYRLHRH